MDVDVTQATENISNLTWYKGLRDPHGKIATDPKHAATEDVGGSADHSNADKCAGEELHPVFWDVHLHQHRGHHEHQQHHDEGGQDSNLWRQPMSNQTEESCYWDKKTTTNKQHSRVSEASMLHHHFHKYEKLDVSHQALHILSHYQL